MKQIIRRTKGTIIRDTARTIVTTAIKKHGADPSTISSRHIETAAKELLWHDPMKVLNKCYYTRRSL